jgi:glycosyltransferase involved in cell wall biosynthesis
VTAPTFSVVIPSYQQGPYLEGAVRSCLDQSRGDLVREIIVHDGGSTDGSRDVLQRLADEDDRVVFRSEPDGGQSEALNSGFARASQAWTIWLNADDELASGAIASYARAIERDPEVDVVFGNTAFIDEAGRFQHRAYTVGRFARLLRAGVYVPPTSGSAFRTALMKQQPLDEGHHYTMDVEWFLRTSGHLRCRALPSDGVRFRVWAGSKTAETTRSGEIPPAHAAERRRNHLRYGLLIDASTFRQRLRRSSARMQLLVAKAFQASRAAVNNDRQR